MKKLFILLFIFSFFSKPVFSQVEDRFTFLKESEVSKFVQPMVTTLGTALNSSSYHTAHVPAVFGFSIGFKGMMVLIPEDQLTFTPTLPNGYNADMKTATIYGSKGGFYAGPNGYITYPEGINEKNIPLVYPQLTASLLGTEVLLRYLPEITVGDRKLSVLGLGLKHSISQYIPLLPVDIAAQILYNSFKVSDLIDVSNIAFNAEVSKTFGLFTAYGGLQYESTKFELNYTLKGDPASGDPELRNGKKITANIDGKNQMRMTLGGALNLAFITLNADLGLGSQTVVTTGLTFAF
ncbi:MAG: DUF6588 family protein [Methanococcaceae archaeon]